MAEGNEYAFPHQIEVGHQDTRGMTLRDYFAAQAMNRLVERWGESSIKKSDEIAKFSYVMADAMLSVRLQ